MLFRSIVDRSVGRRRQNGEKINVYGNIGSGFRCTSGSSRSLQSSRANFAFLYIWRHVFYMELLPCLTCSQKGNCILCPELAQINKI